MRCPACKGSLPTADVWICPHCEHILEPSLFEDEKSPSPASPDDHATMGVAWDNDLASEPELPDAIILGEGPTSGRQPSFLSGAGAGPDGRTSTFLYYSAASPRVVSPDAIPRRASRSHSALTPYEGFVLRCVDGLRSVRHIRRLSGLGVEEVVVTLLTLLDKGVITFPTTTDAQPDVDGTVVDVDDLVLTATTPPDPAITEDATLDLPPQGESSAPEPVVSASPPPTDFYVERRQEGEQDISAESVTDTLDLNQLRRRHNRELVELAELDEGEGVDLYDIVDETSEGSPPGILHEAPLDLEAQRELRGTARRSSPLPVSTPETRPPQSRSQPEEAPRGSADEGPISALAIKAAKLYEQAQADQADGNLVSARMNIRLALTFDPSNRTYQEALERAAQLPNRKPPSRDEARELYDDATRAEKSGDFDRAIALIEKALSLSKQGAFYNRLGVLYAMRKLDYRRAQGLIEQAIELNPQNAIYQRNLQKVLSMAATKSLKANEKPRRSIFGFLRGKGR